MDTLFPKNEILLIHRQYTKKEMKKIAALLDIRQPFH